MLSSRHTDGALSSASPDDWHRSER
jgi:hypothetical protein